MGTTTTIGRLTFLLLLSLSLCSACTQAIYVPGDQPTIQAAIDAAVVGDLVIVEAGTYAENIDFLGKAITVLSLSGPAKTCIDGGQLGSVVTFQSSEPYEAVIDGFTIRNGQAVEGGGIYCFYSQPTITNCSIEQNHDSQYGGGICSIYSNAVITDCTIDGNSASMDGGGFYCKGGEPRIENCSILSNHAGHYGGGIYGHSTDPIITDCAIEENSAEIMGAGSYFYNANALFTNCTISGNEASGDPSFGGGIYCEAGILTIADCAITLNTAGGQGGGVFAFNTDMKITDCTVSENNGLDYGGGVYSAGPNSHLEMTGTTISENISDIGGGLIVDYADGTTTVANCVIAGNQAQSLGGGIYYALSDSTKLVNCTVAYNLALVEGGGIYCDVSSLEIRNCILWGDEAPSGPELFVGFSSYSTVVYSDVQGGKGDVHVYSGSTLSWPGGNIDAAPLFLGTNDYHIGPGSPCIDAGGEVDLQTDIDGQSRPFGGGFDMGADEFWLGQCAVLAPSGNQFVALYFLPALALLFLARLRFK